MDYKDFLDWLINERKLKNRSARDIISRLKRVKRMLGTEVVNENTLFELEKCALFKAIPSHQVRAQLRYSLSVYLKFISKKS